jgi:hypothetical protein
VADELFPEPVVTVFHNKRKLTEDELEDEVAEAYGRKVARRERRKFPREVPEE